MKCSNFDSSKALGYHKVEDMERYDDTFDLDSIDDSCTSIKTRKSRKLYPTVPDRSGGRYIVDELRDSGKQSRSVLFEEIDLTTYTEPVKLVGFKTSAERLNLWIHQMQCRYHDSIGNLISVLSGMK